MRQSPDERFDAKIEKTDECWLWRGAISSAGYGTFTVDGRSLLAHRYSVERYHGPIPDGMQVDHLCNVRRCVRPEHLDVVTPRQNNARTKGSGAVNASKAFCVRGHPFNARGNGRRYCPICSLASKRGQLTDPRHGPPGSASRTQNEK